MWPLVVQAAGTVGHAVSKVTSLHVPSAEPAAPTDQRELGAAAIHGHRVAVMEAGMAAVQQVGKGGHATVSARPILYGTQAISMEVRGAAVQGGKGGAAAMDKPGTFAQRQLQRERQELAAKRREDQLRAENARLLRELASSRNQSAEHRDEEMDDEEGGELSDDEIK